MKNNSNHKSKNLKARKGKSLKERVKQHLTDKNDVITEQDLKDVVVGEEAVDLSNPDEPTILAEDVPAKKIITSWDIVDEKE